MEEQIKQILWPTSFMMEHDRVRIAKEITSHVMEFIEWIGKNPKIRSQQGICRNMTTEEVYLYWLTNVKQ